MKKFVLLFVVVLILFSWVVRHDILLIIGNFLIEQDPVEQVEHGFVLGGQAYDRSKEAGRLFEEGYINQIICVGGNVSGTFKVLKLKYTESEVARMHLCKNLRIPKSKVKVLPESTSTKEESELILKYCLNNNISKVVVITSKFHTKRVANVFKNYFKENGVEVLVHGVSSSDYEEEKWWESEQGMLVVNNEYMKLLYYFVVY